MSNSDRKREIREAAESDLVRFIYLISPKTILGSVHIELCNEWTRDEAGTYQLALLPRDHQKSRLVAFRTIWNLTKHPEFRFLYISSTSLLAEKQLKFMKDILTSKVYRRYWPEMVNLEEGKRAKWTNTEIELDHPIRNEEGIRDPSIITAGLTTSITGLHCDVAVMDDVVVKENAYTKEGRDKVQSQYSLLSSVEAAEASEWVVGTRYHPKDLYNDLISMVEEVYDDEGNVIDEIPVYEVFERVVEDAGNGTGEFLWPRQQRPDGKWFGFDMKILAKKRAKYLDRTQYRAQYYNDPNDPEGGGIKRDVFQYYDKKHLTREGGIWYYRDRRLNVFASVDFAYSLSKKADYTAIVVVGIDSDNNIYVLDIARFKTEKISEYYKNILELHIKWGYRKIKAEVTAAQKAIVKDLKESYIKPNGLALSIIEHKPNKYMGSKEERMGAVLDPRYDNRQIWHYQGGNCQVLEDELVAQHPAHDDVKDALASVIEIAVAPTYQRHRTTENNVVYNTRFGGVAYG